jgi:phenylalanyl-tRNA synthetase alpha chain
VPDYDPKQVAALQPEAIERMTRDALLAINRAATLDALAEVKPLVVGDRSPLALANREIGALPPAAKVEAGRRMNEARRNVQKAYDDKLAHLERVRDEVHLKQERVDVTLPWDRAPKGGRHPLTMIQDYVADVFVAMGYEVAEGPLVETEWHNFDALNMSPDHPARSEHDTIWLDPPERGLLLRTHTSPVQLRALLARDLPIYVVAPGRVVRNDPLDATHSPVFHQVECLVVDEGITMAHLRGTIDAFARAVFGEGIASRMRPSYFPFTEPSAEVDLQCFACKGDGCRICSGEGWIEWGGCGMVHPNVLRAAGVDPDRYSGYAFGMGLERLLMFRHGIDDMRHFFEGDVRLTTAFGTEL